VKSAGAQRVACVFKKAEQVPDVPAEIEPHFICNTYEGNEDLPLQRENLDKERLIGELVFFYRSCCCERQGEAAINLFCKRVRTAHPIRMDALHV
jgi:hypothetical protein